MEFASEDDFHSKRREVRGGASDQGAESHIAHATVNVLVQLKQTYDAGDIGSFLYPRMLSMIGHLHVLYNCLEHALEKNKMAVEYIEHRAKLGEFLSDKELRGRFVLCCCRTPHEVQIMSHRPTIHISW